jgi:hypothetical protein
MAETLLLHIDGKDVPARDGATGMPPPKTCATRERGHYARR